MASSSHRRSGSSARSSQRKKVHVGTGTTSRKASAHPSAQVEAKGKPRSGTGKSESSRARPEHRDGASGRTNSPQRPTSRPLSAKQIERQEKRAQQRKAMLLRVCAAVGAAIVLWALWTGLSRSELFVIQRIEVTGTARIAEDEVIALASIDDGETLLQVDTDEIMSRLRLDPWIASADISRRFPSTLRIDVKERVPAAVVDTGLTFWFVEYGGRVLAESAAASATVVPVVRDVPDFIAEPGTVSESEILQNALDVLAGLSDDLRASVRTVSAPSIDETALLTGTGVEIMVGEAVDMAEKSVLITDILGAQGESVVFIDVRSIERPISRGLTD